MSDQLDSHRDLTPQEKRALLERLLREKAAKASLQDADKSTHRSPITPVSRDQKYFPLSSAQQRIWLLDQFEPGTPTYNIPFSLRLEGTLDLEALEATFNEIVKRHEPLRTNFRIENEQPVQEILPARPITVRLINLDSIPKSSREVELERLVQEEVRRPFDLEKDLKMRIALLRTDPEDHLLVVTLHHISSDGWTLGVLLKEFISLYNAFSSGKPSPLANLNIQYVDFVYWQQKWFAGDVFDRQLDYWKNRLHAAPSLLELPTDRPRPPMQSYHGDRHLFRFPLELTDSLKSFSRKEGCTLFMTLLAAFQTLLFRYTGQEDISIGSPVAGRSLPEVSNLIGLFINTIVLRADLSNNPTFREFLGQVRNTTLSAYEHSDLPFEKLVEELQPVRSLSYPPIFQVMFVLQNTPFPALKLDSLQITSFKELSTGTSKFDLYLSLMEFDGGLVGELEYNTALFDPGTIARMAGHFESLVQNLIKAPDKPLSEINFLPDVESQLILRTWNQTQMPYASCCIHHMFEIQAQRTPDKTAVVFENTRITYQNLDRRANQLAHYLQMTGVQPETIVGLFMDRSVNMIVGLLGILKAGGAYLPLDPAFPADRLEFMLVDSQTPILLTQENLSNTLSVNERVKVVRIDSEWPEISKSSDEPCLSSVQPENLAYVIYTSGSTGRPKGVQIEHRSVVNFLTSMQRQPGITEQDILLSVTTLSFDIAGLEIFLPLISGASVELLSRETATDAGKLMSAMEKGHVTIMQATPVTWRMLIESGWQGNPDLKILCGGEVLDLPFARQILERSKSLWNMYGPTETTIWSTICQVQKNDPQISIGRPIGNTECYVLDPYLQPVPVGVTGELYIGGDGLARGYWNREGLTKEKFIPHPFCSATEARLYKTGDLVRYSSDGNLHYLGRADHQIKIRGFRVELGEIETVLSQHPAVRETVVIVREDSPGDKRLVGYLVLRDGQIPPSNSELISFTRKQLPDYMLPGAFVFLDHFPLTPNKKINRKALPVPDQTRPDLTDQYVAPRDEIEECITGIFASVLKLERVGIYDKFFELGGHSLLATQVISRIRQELEVDLPLQRLFESPTPEDLATAVIRTRLSQVDQKELEEIFANLENLSIEETKALLNDEEQAEA